MGIFDVTDITLIKDEMDENSISYWEAVAIICYGYEYEESFLRFDMEVYKESEPVIEWKTGEDIFKKKIIKNIIFERKDLRWKKYKINIIIYFTINHSKYFGNYNLF